MPGPALALHLAVRNDTRQRLRAHALLWAALLTPLPVPADSIALNPSADTTLIEAAPDRNNGAEGWVNANEIATGNDAVAKELPQGATPTQLAAYTVVARVLLNLDETITKE